MALDKGDTVRNLIDIGTRIPIHCPGFIVDIVDGKYRVCFTRHDGVRITRDVYPYEVQET